MSYDAQSNTYSQPPFFNAEDYHRLFNYETLKGLGIRSIISGRSDTFLDQEEVDEEASIIISELSESNDSCDAVKNALNLQVIALTESNEELEEEVSDLESQVSDLEDEIQEYEDNPTYSAKMGTICGATFAIGVSRALNNSNTWEWTIKSQIYNPSGTTVSMSAFGDFGGYTFLSTGAGNFKSDTEVIEDNPSGSRYPYLQIRVSRSSCSSQYFTYN